MTRPRTRSLSAGLAAITCLSASIGQAQVPARCPRQPLVEVARAAVGATTVVERDGLRGRGAALCLVDTGVDASIPDLRDANDAPRVRWMWDAFVPARGMHPDIEAAAGGAVWGSREIDGAPVDLHGHGTAMAAIALGDDAGPAESPGPRSGIAPAAGLLVARAYDRAQAGFPDDAVVRAIRFCRAAAERDPELDPGHLVILLSLGGHDGAHDGQGAFEQAILEASGAIPVVVAAGNDGERAVHASGRGFAHQDEDVEIRIPSAAEVDGWVTVSIDYRARSPQAGFTIVTPSGTESPLYHEPPSTQIGFTEAVVTIESDPDNPAHARVTLRAHEGATLGAGTYRLRFKGAGAFDVWLAGHRLGDTFLEVSLGGRHVRSDETIQIPATAPSVIAVGATVARASVDVGSGTRTQQADASGAATFSSVGPTSAGVPKPDVVAPGGWVLVPLSGGVVEGDRENLVGGRIAELRASDQRVAIRGSSVAAAIVAGALLLMGERDPTRLARARELLIASAEGTGWSPHLGWGELRVPRLLERWGGAADGRRELAVTRPYVPSDDVLWVTARSPGLDLAILFDGQSYSTPILAGAAQLAIPIGPRTVGEVLWLYPTIDGQGLAPISADVILERVGPATLSRGGCAVGRGLPPIAVSRNGALWVFLFGLVGLSRGRGSHETSGLGRRARPRPQAAPPCL